MLRPLAHGDIGRDGDDRPYAVLDVETDGLRGDLIWWAAGCECDDRLATGTDAGSLWRHVLSHDGASERRGESHNMRDHLWWAHNGGEYDYLYLFPYAREDALSGHSRITPLVRAGGMIGFRIDASRHRTDLRDSYALMPSGLAALTAELAPDLPKGHIDFEHETFDPSNPAHRDYSERDVRGLLAVLTRFRRTLSEMYTGALPSWSAASTALRCWQRTIPEGTTYRRPPRGASDLARAGYFGGMVHLSTTAETWDCATIDYNAMYPTVMRSGGVPDGIARPVRRYVAGLPGFYRVSVRVPVGAPFTFVPYRDSTGSIAWPVGAFETVISSLEYERARAAGYHVRVLAGWVWERLSYPFGDFVDGIERYRLDAGGAVGFVAKIMGNSLYGKFGAKPERDEYMISADRPGDEWLPYASDPLDADRYEGLWTHPKAPLRAAYLMPHWAAWITAGARMVLTAGADAIGAANVLYTDTDSLTAPRLDIERAIASGAISVGREFGKVKVEHRWRLFRPDAPKVYTGWAETGYSEIETLYKAKGIPRRQMVEAFAGESVAWDSPNGAITVLAGGPMMTARHRFLSSIEGSVAWRGEPGGPVRPVRLGTIGTVPLTTAAKSIKVVRHPVSTAGAKGQGV